MDSKSLIIGILVVVVIALGITAVMNNQAPTDTTNDTNGSDVNITNNSNGSGNVTPTPTPTPTPKPGKLISAAQAIAIVKAASPDALVGTFSAFLTTYAGKPMYKVSYAVTQDIGYDTVSCYVDARTGTIYGEYQTVGGNNNNNNNKKNNTDNNNTDDDIVYY